VSSTVQADLDLQTVICQVSRESGAAAKLQQPADASLTICWCQLLSEAAARLALHKKKAEFILLDPSAAQLVLPTRASTTFTRRASYTMFRNST
jgi:hypothetical protein